MRLLVLALLMAGPAHAGLGTLVKMAAKAGKVAGKAGSAAKVAKVAKVGTAAKGAKLIGLVGGATLLERSGLVFRMIPDDVGTVGRFLGKADGELAMVSRSGEVSKAPSVGQLLDDLSGVDELYVDPSVALQAGDALKAVDGVQLHAVDAAGELHRITRRVGDDGTVELLVDAADAGGTALDIAQFAMGEVAEADAASDQRPLELMLAPGLDCAADLGETRMGEAFPDGFRAGGDPARWLQSNELSRVVVLGPGSMDIDPLTAAAAANGHTLAAFTLDEPCARVMEVYDLAEAEAGSTRMPMLRAGTLADAQTPGGDPLLLSGRFEGAPAGIMNAAWVLPVDLSPWSTVEASEPDDDDPPAWFIVLVVLGGVGLLWFKTRQYRRAQGIE